MTSAAEDPIVPPIPVPDIAGADAGRRGLPDRSELSTRDRLIVDSSAIVDVGLRTVVASLVSTAIVPPIIANSLHRASKQRELDNMRFYAELAQEHDPTLSFPAPTSMPRIYSRPANPVAEWFAHGRVHNIRFDSSFQAVNPAMRESWRQLSRNNVVHAQHWRHEDGPHPTLCVVHGFMGSAYLLNGLFFSLPWFYRSGFDVLLYTLPFHSRRAEKDSPFSGYGFFSHGVSGFAEAVAQAVHDFRSLVDYLEYTGVEKIAVTGISLGGFTSALLAAVDDRLQAVIPNVPVVSIPDVLKSWEPASRIFEIGRKVGRMREEDFLAAAAFPSPLNYRPLVPKDRRLIITGLGDRLAPPEQSEMLWEHWDRCELHWFPGNHVLHVSQPEYLRRMTRFMREFMFD